MLRNRVAFAVVMLLLIGMQAPGSLARERSFDAVQRAAEAGDTQAQYDLAMRFGTGAGVEVDHDAARQWLWRSARGGYAAAQSAIGVLLFASDDEAQRATALEWLQKAAAQGDMIANMQLGTHALDTDRRDEALVYFERAAEVGDREVQLALATMYEHGEVTPANAQRAVHWYRRSAAAGNLHAQHQLGTMYAYGEGVERDAAAAYVWMWVALRGDPDDPSRARVAEWLSPQLRTQLDEVARSWTSATEIPSAPLDLGPPAPTSGRIVVTIFDYDKLGPGGGLPPSRQRYWRIVDAVAVRNEGGHGSVLLSTSLIDPASVDEVAGDEFGLHRLPGLTLYIDPDGRLTSGMFNHEGGYVELLVSAVEADIEVDSQGIRGRVSLPLDSERFLQTRYSIEVQFDAPFHTPAKPAPEKS